jgi:hypothetical protein
LKKKHNMKKTISIAMFISEFGEAFTSHMKLKLLEIGKSCVLIREETGYSFDLKHVEHKKQHIENADGTSNMKLREYTYGQILVHEEILYFSMGHKDGDEQVQFPAISDLYKGLDVPAEFLQDDIEAKKIDDSNVDYLVDTLNEIYPELSPEYLKIIGRYRKK